MTLITRHPQAPWLSGEVLNAGVVGNPQGLELDMAALFADFNGGLSDVNFRTGASIVGDKFAPQSIPGAKLAASAVTAEKVAPGTWNSDRLSNGAVTRAKIQENAIHQLAFVQASVVPSVQNWTTIVSTVLVTGPVLAPVLVQGRVSLRASLASGQTTGNPKGEMRLRRGDVTLRETLSGPVSETVSAALGLTRSVRLSMSVLDQPPANSATPYTLEFRSTDSTATFSVTDQEPSFLTALELRR